MVFAVSPLLLVATGAQQHPRPVAIDADDIGGVVTGPNGPEAGVWVIAETRDLPVRYIKIVVTDDQGRYVIPDLPKARYNVWVRGYGLVDSAKSTSEPGQTVNVTADAGADEAAAAQYYPAIYWYSMLQIPAATELADRERFRANMTQRRLARIDEEHRLHRLPPARAALDADDSRRRSARSRRARRRGTGACSRARPASMMIGQLNGLGAGLVQATSATGPTASPKASCRTPSRSVRRASSATSSSRCATG